MCVCHYAINSFRSISPTNLISNHPAGCGLQLYNIGLIDVQTCLPVPNALVDIWQANATGHYSQHPVPSPHLINETAPTSGKRKGMLSPYPRTEPGETFLRGAWPTDGNGVVAFTSVFPGYYTGRATRESCLSRTSRK